MRKLFLFLTAALLSTGLWADNTYSYGFNDDVITAYDSKGTKITELPYNGTVIDISSTASIGTAYVTSTSSKESCVSISADAAENYAANYLEIASTEDIKSVYLVAAVTGSTSGSEAVAVGWTSSPSADINEYHTFTTPGKGGTTGNEITISFSTEGIKYVRLYRKIKLDADTKTKFQKSSSSTIPSSGSTYGIAFIKVTTTPSCAATVPGNISKGTLTSGTLTLNAAGSAVSGDTWYWQTEEDGTSTSSSGSSFDVTEAGTYYVRSYNTAADCWSDAKSIVVTASDFLPAPTITFSDGEYVKNVTGETAPLDLSTLFESNSDGAVTYSVKTDGGTNATIEGANFSATAAGTCVVTASQAATASYASATKDANIVVSINPLGEGHVLTWNIIVSTSSSESNVSGGTTDIGTNTPGSTSTLITTLTDLTGNGVKRTTTGKNSNTGKIETPASYDADKYVTMTFAVANGYKFTPSAVSIKTVAVSTTKDLKFEISDANGSYSVTKTNLSTNATAATNNLDFSDCDKSFTGTVTVKIYVYGADDAYRLSTPLTITGTVAAIPYAINIAAMENGEVTANKATATVGEIVTLTVTPDDKYEATGVYYNGNEITPVENVYSFTMPAEAVTITATFAKSSTAVENVESSAKAVKSLKNGVLIIEKNGKKYNIIGSEIR